MSVKPVSFPFHCYVQLNTASNVASLQLTPSALASYTTRLAAMSDLYSVFRWKRCSYRQIVQGGTGEIRAMGVASAVLDTPPTGLSATAELRAVTIVGAGEVSRPPWVTIPQNVLRGSLPWYKSVAGAADPWDEVPAIIYAYSQTATGAVTFELDGECEFKSQVAPANTPRLVEAGYPAKRRPPVEAQNNQVATDRYVVRGNLDRRAACNGQPAALPAGRSRLPPQGMAATAQPQSPPTWVYQGDYSGEVEGPVNQP
jgi:hypothetical protein